MEKSILIIGSGPSTKQLLGNFNKINSQIDTFGLSLQFRHYKEINWWPTYYALCDSKVILNLKSEIYKTFKGISFDEQKLFFSYNIKNLNHTYIDHMPTGTFAINKSIELGYKNIYLVGMGGRYVEKIPESKPIRNSFRYYLKGYHKLPLDKGLKKDIRIITRTVISNPNYFIDNYQQVGDIYSLPKGNIHRDYLNDLVKKHRSSVNFYNLDSHSNLKINKAKLEVLL